MNIQQIAASKKMNVQVLENIAASVAVQAANRRLVRLGWSVDYMIADADTIAAAVQEAIDLAWPSAIADAEQARKAGMIDAAAMTMEASFALAGIAAANAHHAATRGVAA